MATPHENTTGADTFLDKSVSSLNLDPGSPIYKNLKIQLDKELQNITAQYTMYVKRIRETLQDKGVTAKDLSANLLNFSAFNHDTTEQRLMLMSAHKAELWKAVDLYDVFDLVSTVYASFLNYGIFQLIVNIYQIDHGQEELKYPQHLRTYINKHNLSECPPGFREVTGGSSKLILKIDIEETSGLSKIVDIQSAIASILGMNFETLQLLNISDGCVVATFLIPTHIADIVFNKLTVFTEKQVQMFQAELILTLECNDHTFNFVEMARDDADHDADYVDQKDEQKGQM